MKLCLILLGFTCLFLVQGDNDADHRSMDSPLLDDVTEDCEFLPCTHLSLRRFNMKELDSLDIVSLGDRYDGPRVRHKRWIGALARLIPTIARIAKVGVRVARVGGRAVVRGTRVGGRAVVRGARTGGRAISRGAGSISRVVVSRGGTVWRGIGRGVRVAGRGINYGTRYVGRGISSGSRATGRGLVKFGKGFVRYGRPAFEIMDMVCTGVQLGISITDASMSCPSYKRTLCREAAELREGSERFNRTVSTFNEETTKYLFAAEKVNTAVLENRSMNTTMQRVFMLTSLLEELAHHAPVIETYLPIFRDNNVKLHGFRKDLFDKLTIEQLDKIGKPAGWTREITVSLVQFGLSYAYNMASLLNRVKSYRNLVNARRSPMQRLNYVKNNGINSMVIDPNGRFGLGNYGKIYKVDQTGRPIRQLSKGEMYQMKHGMIPDRSKVTSLFGKTITSNRRGFRVAKTINFVGKVGSFALPIVSTAFCIYNIVDMTHTQTELARQEIRGLKVRLQNEERYLNGNKSLLRQYGIELKGNFTEYVAGTTVVMAGLLRDAADEWIEYNPTETEEISIIRRKFQYINNTLESRNAITFDNIATLQVQVEERIDEVLKLVVANIEVAKIIAIVDASMNQTVPPSKVQQALRNMTIRSNLRSILSIAADLRPNVSYYFGYPLCLYRIANSPDPIIYTEISEQVMQDIKFLVVVENSVDKIVERLRASGSVVTRENLVKILATEIFADESSHFGINLAPYRQECN